MLLTILLSRKELCLSSILCDCESVMNSRPLTYLSEDPLDLIPLTPAMFLQDNKSIGVPDLDYLDNNNFNKRYKYNQRLRNELRTRFREEYLSQLLVRKDRNYLDQLFKVGDVVLVGSDDKKRLVWPLAKVVDLYPGKDGVVRVAKLKTSTGSIIRPIQRLFPLESVKQDFNLNTKTVQEGNCESSLKTRYGRQIKSPNKLDI